ncbi:MAG: Ribosome modulation factor [Candidatus Erwinia impunctatus]|nr:Ribosome modulation factor [Culicoides impunctatus]
MMKRQKRDRLERAHSRGYQAGISGHNKEMCPYQTLDARPHWLGGWRRAMEHKILAH